MDADFDEFLHVPARLWAGRRSGGMPPRSSDSSRRRGSRTETVRRRCDRPAVSRGARARHTVRSVKRYVFAPEDIVWHKTDLGTDFWLGDDLVDTDYTSAFTAQVTKFGPGGGSPLHTHPYNHAFYFLGGTCRVQIGEHVWHVGPGSFVKVPAHEQHMVTNTGDEDLIFLVIYDPPPE